MKNSSTLSVVTVKLSDGDLLCDNSTGSLRPLVPEVLRKSLFNALHNISHPGIRGSRRLISARFVWPGLSQDVGVWARACLQCQQSKVQTHVNSSVPAISVPSRRFSHVHIDIVGPLPSSKDCSYILTMIDRTTPWPEAVPLSSISTETCVKAFISAWILRFGVPATLTSDRGAQFTSSVWTQVSDWVSHLSLVLLGLRSVPKEDTGFSISEAVYGSALTIPGEFLDGPELPSSQFLSKIRKVISGFSIPPPHHVPQQPPTEVPAPLWTAKFIFVREDVSKPSLGPLYRGPYLVLERRSKFFHLQISQKVDSVSVDRLNQCFLIPL